MTPFENVWPFRAADAASVIGLVLKIAWPRAIARARVTLIGSVRPPAASPRHRKA